MPPSSVYALVRLLVVRKLYWSEVIVVASVHVHDYVPRTGDQEVPVKPGFLFLSRRRTTILSHYRVLYRQVPRSIVLDTVSSFSVFCRRLYIALARGVAASGNQECILLSSLVFVQKIPRCCSSSAFGKHPFVLRMSLLLASNVVPCILGLSSFRFSILLSLSVPLRRRRRPLVPPPPRPFLRSWLAEPRRGGEGEGHFFQMQLGTAAFGGGHGW
jgi:hypothetical protein